ncbi:hypothetical protein METESE_06510 [Mesoterricola sediminis]|uniref:NodB homology domain-containing protein n=2 Tax=Mesoterricola sediminis TaxID=2927980 RepID=A0AA48HCD0_9BACT|nr:hypothetical protein METESE_06510 [Mesoterricola sediminis]
MGSELANSLFRGSDKIPHMRFPLSAAHLTGLAAFQLALGLLFVDPRLAAIPLAAFVLLTLLAPLFPAFPYFLPIVTHGDRRRPRVALSFDDGPDPEVTPRVLDLLDEAGVKAVFFMVARKAEAHPDLVREVLARGHAVGNHSLRHDTLLMLKGPRALRADIVESQAVFRRLGVVPRAFRPPVGITNPDLWNVLLDEGLFCMNFSCRAGDLGNRRVQGLAARILGRVRPGDLLLLHDGRPPRLDVDQLLGELRALLQGLRARNLELVPPGVLVGRELMARAEGAGIAERFYDDLAEGYDAEQFESPVARSRTLEQRLFRAHWPRLSLGAGRVLEVGAGTGIFTLEIAAACREVHALDLSERMLEQLRRKAERAGLSNIVTRQGDAERLPLEGPYSVLCAFLAFEYFHDLPGFLKRVGPHMEPGARLYFCTARRSFFRFWTQVGNAMRQGIWLRARSRREVEAMLREAGIEVVRIEGHLLKVAGLGGMLLEVEGRWPETPRA